MVIWLGKKIKQKDSEKVKLELIKLAFNFRAVKNLKD